jgi:predicted lipoprotein with Yx(FWY)xxD motif
MTRAPLLLLITVTAFLAACGDADKMTATPRKEAAAPAPAATAAPAREKQTRKAKPKRGTTVKVVDSQFGPILADGRGQAFYFFDKETTSKPRCYGACAEAWPPVYAKGRPVAGKGARKGLIGVTKRRDGRRQVTYNGRPLYYYMADRPGLVLCHDVEEFGGLWVVIRPDGTRVP